MPLRNNISKHVDEFKEVLNEAKIESSKLENDKKTSIENFHQSSPMVLKSPSQNDKTKSPMKEFKKNFKAMNSINASDSKTKPAAGNFTNNTFVFSTIILKNIFS